MTWASSAATRSRSGSSAGSPAASRWAVRSLPAVSSSSTCWRAALERAPGEHGGRDQPGLVLHQAELARLPGDGPLDEAPARELPQPLDDLRQQQGIELTRGARGAAQDGQDVLGGRLARGGVGERARLTARLVERRLVEPPGVGEPEPAQHPEAMADGVAEDDLRGQPLAELAHVLGQVGLLRVRCGGQLGERRNDPDPGPPERLSDLGVADGPAERARSRATVAGPTWVAAPASASASRAS